MSETTIKIEKGIPIPRQLRNGSNITAIISQMEIGDSILLPVGYSRESAHSSAHRLLRKIVTRKEGDTFRVWRTA